ncbi:hypothetical protein Hanom_Chr04g00353751 [Helianthus anomalus]
MKLRCSCSRWKKRSRWSGGDTRARRMKPCRSEFLATFKNGTKTFLCQ